MSSKQLVKSYGVTTSDNVNYELTFSIPDNCDYKETYAAGIHNIFVGLKTGALQPSQVYITYKLNFTMVNGGLDVEFEQQNCGGDGGSNTTTKRPIVRIED